MWWIVVSCLLIFNRHISSQPLEVKDNVRQTRQLDFGECCPCPGAGQAGQGIEAPGHPLSSFEGPYSRARDVDDCPCRGRSSDSEGAPSVFFPTAVRPDGHVVRPTETKEDPKPLLHPEVDLASSVLETLREATDEEYKEALARDAARSMGRSANEVLFGDTVPDASTSNLVTIIMSPKHTEGLDNIVPEESRVQETRCVHGPLGSSKSSPVQLRTAKKPPNLLRELFGLPQLDQLEDMDNGVGASNIQERVVKVDEDQAPSKTKIGLRKYAPVLKPDIIRNDISTTLDSNLKEIGIGSRVPTLKLPKTTLTELLNQRLLEDKEKIIPLPSIPKFKLNNSLLKPVPDLIEDMSVSPSDIQEQAKRNFFEAKSHLDNILQKANTGPLSLKNLLKLKDVEFVPLKDLVKTPTLTIPQLNVPGIFDKEENYASIEEQTPVNLIKSTGTIGKLSMSGKNEMLDAEVSPSNMIEQVNNDNCNGKAAKSAEMVNGLTEADDTVSEYEGEISNEMIDSATSPNTQSEVISDNNADMESNELGQTTDDCNMNASLMTEPPFQPSIQPSERSFLEEDTEGDNRDEIVSDNSEERSIDNITEEDTESNTVTNDENCTDNVNDMDSLTDSSNNINSVVKPDHLEFNQDRTPDNNNVITEEPCSEEQSFIENVKPPGTGQTTKLIRPLSLDKAISSIKENLKNRFENIKNTKPIPKKAKIFEEKNPNNSEDEEKLPTVMDNQPNSNCQDEELLQVTTPKAVICGDELTDNDESANKVSMQDLQKISDSMLQREEQERASKAACNGLSSVDMEPKMSTEENSKENEKDSEISANTQKIVIMDPREIVDTDDRNNDDFKNSCKSELALPKQTEEVTDASGSASQVVASVLPQNNVVRPPLLFDKVVQPKLDLLNLPVPDINDLIKIEPIPIPTLDDIKTGLDNLLGSTGGKAREQSRADVASSISTPNALSKTMSTDASTKSFKSRLPPLGLEDINLDILQLKPQTNLLKKLPKLELPTTNKLLLPDLQIKPLKLQTKLNDKGLLAGRKNPLDIFPNLETPGSRMKTLSSKRVKTSRKPDVLKSSLTPTKGIEELTDDLESHAKHTLRHMQKTLQSTLRAPTSIPTKLQSNDLLETIARNHEDVSDKLKALHMDFNDRLETMRNNLFDSSLFESHTPEPVSSFSSKIKERKSSLKTAKPESLTSRLRDSKKSKPRTQKQGGLRLSSQTNENKFRMPVAASVTVPKTLKVPTLKPIEPEPQGLLKPKPITIPTKIKAVSPALWKKESEKLNTNTKLTNKINPFKNSKIEVTFSTTPRPVMPRAQFRKLTLPSSLSDRNMRRFGASDNSGSPSDMRSAVVSSPISNQDYKLGSKAVDRENGPDSLTRLQKVTGKGGRLGNSQSKLSSNLESWPKASESAFLSKVKEAVKARLSKAPVLRKSEDVAVSSTDIDMSHAASENVGVVENKVLKENVSYKCTMVCTKE